MIESKGAYKLNHLKQLILCIRGKVSGKFQQPQQAKVFFVLAVG